MANAENPRAKASPGLQKLRLREDVSLIYANPATGKGQVRVVDPRSGRQFSFDEREFLLLRAADGTADAETVHQRLQAEAGVTFALSEVTEFFRRMQILGLFEVAPADVAPKNPVARRGIGDSTFAAQRARKIGSAPAAADSPRQTPAKAAPAPEPVKAGPGRITAGPLRKDSVQAAPTIRSVKGEIAGMDSGTGPTRSAPEAVTPVPVESGATRDDATRPLQVVVEQPPAPVAVLQAAVVPPGEPAADPKPQDDPVRHAAAAVGPAAAPAPVGQTTPDPVSWMMPEVIKAAPPATLRQPRAPSIEAREPEPFTPEAPLQAAKLRRQEGRFKLAPTAAKPAQPVVIKPVDPKTTRVEKARAARAKSKKDALAAAALEPEAVPPTPAVVVVEPPVPDAAPVTGLQVVATTQPQANGDKLAPAATDLPLPPAAQTGDDELAAFEFQDADFDDPDGGAFGLRGGRMGGGLRGGMMGGMMGGGGMLGGGANRERLLAAIAARGGAGGGLGGMAGGLGGGMGGALGGGGLRVAMAGGMGGGMRARAAEPAATPKPAELPLFNPEPLLRLLYVLGYPLKMILWAIVPLVVIAGLAIFNNLQAFRQDTVANLADFSSVTQFMLGLFIVNLISRLAQGVAIVAHGGRAQTFGMGLALGVIPRFFVDKQGLAELDRRGQLWAFGAPLLARVALFAIGTLFWATNRDQGGMLPQISLITAKFGLVMFVATACPLVPSDGLRWVSVLFNEPRLAGKAAAAFKHVFLGGNLPPMIGKADTLPLALFAVAVALTTTALVGVIGLSALIWLEAELGGMGVIFFLGIAAAFILWLLATFASLRSRAGAGGRAFDAAAFRKMTLGEAAEESEADPEAQATPASATSMSARARVIWTLIAAGLLALAFQPYSYETGGAVEISPAARGQAVARTEGEIVEVMVQQGDLIEQGQTVARLSFWDQQSDIAVTEARLQGAQAKLARTEAGKKPEEVELARRELASAEADLLFVQAEAQRTRDLAATGTVSKSTLDKADGNYASALAEVEVARAKLALAESAATPEELAVARAEVEQLDRELAFQRDELERTHIVAPISGRVITPDLNLRQGSFLRAGETLIEIERADLVAATIAVPESDITLIAPGRVVRLKVYGQSGDEIPGTVQLIAPAAEDAGYGRIVRVTAVFRNDDGFLRSGMTGYAKIESAEMRVWEAYLRSITRFFQIEVWSWIP